MGSSLVSSKPFIFEDFWTRDASCYYVIAKAWDSVSPTNINIVSLFRQKIAATQKALTSWNKIHYGFIQDRILALTQAIDCNNQKDPSVANSNLDLHLRFLLDEQLQREQLLWKTRSRVTWLQQKELNTKFFYTSTIIRRNRNLISSPQNSAHQWISDRDGIGDLIQDYYYTLFTSSNPTIPENLDSFIQQIMTPPESLGLLSLSLSLPKLKF